MAKLLKLQICGIRSFGPYEEDLQQVSFSSPLTLFLGQNGCGKTTIIESIKYACTGELPPGSDKGQGFVNDPKISNCQSTKGQVKLKILDAKGNEVTVCRSIQVQQKANKLAFSTLDPSLRVKKPGDPDSTRDISGRCLDIDAYVCQALNVSPSILNNVIFCHQENSSWPLEEGKKLKEKFDEIFDSTKYNKCVEHLRKILKNLRDQIKILKVELEAQREIRERVDRQRNRLAEKEEKLQGILETVGRKQSEIEPMDKRLNEIVDLETVLGDLQRRLSAKEEAKKGMISQQNTLKENISFIFEGNDEDLHKKIEDFENDRKKDENTIKSLQQVSKDLEEKAKVLSKTIQTAQMKVGQLKEEKRQFEKKCTERETLLNKACTKLNISDSVRQEDASVVIENLSMSLVSIQGAFDQLCREKEAEEAGLLKITDEIRVQHAGTQQNIKSKTDLIKECDVKIRHTKAAVDELLSSDEQLARLTSRIDEVETTLRKVKQNFNEIEKIQEVETISEDIVKAEQKLEKLDREFRILQQNYVTEEKLESEKQNIAARQREMSKLKNKNSHYLQQLFKDNIPEKDLKKAVRAIQDREEIYVKNINDKITKTQREVTQLETKLQHQRASIKEKEKELKEYEQKMSTYCKGKPFDEVLKESYQKKEKHQRDKGQFSSAKILYEGFVRKFQNDAPCCPICETDFKNKNSAVVQIISKLQNTIARIPSQLHTAEMELKKEEQLYNKLQQLKPVNDNIEMLKNAKLPLLNEELFELDEKYKSLSETLKTLKEELKKPQSNVEACGHLISDAALLDQYFSDVAKSKELIKDLEEQLITLPSNRSRQETEAEIDDLNAELGNLRRSRDSKKKMLDQHKKRCQDLQENKLKFTSQQLQLQGAVQEKPHLEKQLIEYREKRDFLQSEVNDLKSKLDTLATDLQEANENRQAIRQMNLATIEGERAQMEASKKLVDDIKKIQTSINIYIEENNEEQLKSAAEALAEHKSKEEKYNETKMQIIEKISNTKENLAKQEGNLRAYQDNITLRKLQAKENELITVITELKDQIGSHNYKSVYEEKNKITRKKDRLVQEINSYQGQILELESGIADLKRDLNEPQHKTAFKGYRTKFYELKVTEQTLKDLNLYILTLEKAVLEFHKERMVMINKIIRDLWRSIYRGNDIDHIEIQTESSVGTASRRTYNYKVVQIKKGIPLDMRGRCSAGQKVLACLVIRMALAETFSANCGILALDEPTTNLDKTNIDSLSDALARIVETRSHEKNFQLLVITHDEEFLNTITRSQSLSHFWRVSRNPEGFSIIRREYL